MKAVIFKPTASGFMQKMRILAKSALIVLAVVFITHAILIGVMKKGLDKKLDELKANHEPLTFTELAPKPVSEDQNGALLYLDAYAVCFAAYRPPSEPLSLGELLGETSHPYAKPEIVEAHAREILAKCDTAITYVKEAQKRPQCVFPVDWDKGIEAELPHIHKLRRMSEILAVKAVIDAKDNKLDKTIEDVILGIRISDSVSSEPTLISLFCRQSCIRKTLTGLRIVLEEHHLSADQARSIYDELAKVDLQPQYKLAMQGERIIGSDIFGKMRANGDIPFWVLDHAEVIPGRTKAEMNMLEKGLAGMTSYLWLPMSYADQRIYNDQMDKQISMISLSYRDRVNQKPAHEPKLISTSNIIMSGISRTTLVRDKTLADIGLAQATIAAMAYRDRFGSYPASMKDLKSRLGWKIPDDPFSGKPFIYRQKKSGFVIYSIGANLKDDGGKPQPPGKRSDSGNYDIAWKCKM
ncbi:MAG: hypothetical protein ABFD64_01950 [Armatimonadota bacterium]